HEYMEGIRKGEVIGVFVLVDGVLAHWAFILRSSRTSCLLGVGRGEALLGNAYTNPQFRGRGLQTTSLRQRLQECRRLGITHVYTETVPDNWPSRRAMERVGMVFLRDVTLLVVVTRIVVRITNTGRKARLFGLC
ncbi:MAG: GNAT family N-acetyltransferase, partial [Spiribacter salinus]